ncbi:hypothetical protein R1flu_007970 [Riccia fluitans]|uniref:Uncharacterized protein n=1 Tax=Riccia fluitans TaxID=41844 RepID=A0ABD1YAJ0_9MARC
MPSVGLSRGLKCAKCWVGVEDCARSKKAQVLVGVEGEMRQVMKNGLLRENTKCWKGSQVSVKNTKVGWTQGLRYSRNAPGVGYKRAKCWVGLESRVALDPKRRKCWLESRVDMHECWKKIQVLVGVEG